MNNLKSFSQFVNESFSEVMIGRIGSKKWYHGTQKDFASFKLSDGTKNPMYGEGGTLDKGLGVFLTDNLTMAKWFAGATKYDPDKEEYVDTEDGGIVMEVEFKLKNPLILSGQDEDFDSIQEMWYDITEAGGVKEYRKKLAGDGHDGVYLPACSTNYYMDDSYGVIVVLDPSATKIVGRQRF